MVEIESPWTAYYCRQMGVSEAFTPLKAKSRGTEKSPPYRQKIPTDPPSNLC